MCTAPSSVFSRFLGVTLIELLVFIVIVAVALVTFLSVFSFQVTHSVDPVAQVRALEKGQALLDEILSRKFAEDTPTGGVPACSSSGDLDGSCDGITADSGYDDVGDYNGYVDNADLAYPISVAVSVAVSEAGTDLNIANEQARLITVTVGISGSGSLSFSAYRVNF